VTLDRVFLLTDAYRQFDIRAHGLEEVDRFLDAGKGIVMIGAHVGSFEALRIIAQQRPEQSVRPVIDLEQNPSVSRLLNALNPEMASSIINARRSGIETVLAIRDALAKRAIVTLMADRARPENTLVDADFLGRKIGLPIEPWLLASSLKAPVVLCFGLYRGGRRYELFFETFSDQLTIERAHRATQIRECVQRFAERLTHYVRLAPENWFNFYDMWSDGDGFSL
jgi:predicted LPLAT superfamily acyltransferase